MGNYERIRDIIKAKLIDKTEDRDYSELSEELFGKKLESNECRKRCYGAKAIIEAIEEDEKKNIEDEDLLNKLEEKEIELKKERIRLTDVRTKLNKMIREEARRESNLENIKSSIEALPPLQVELKEIKEGNEAVLNFSDFHLGLEVDNYFNQYNKEIAFKRVSGLVSKTITYCKLNNITKLHFVINGDIINGFKHMSLVANADLSVAESISKSSEIISNMIFEFCKEIDSVIVYFATGNHAVMNSNKECLDRDNFEYLIFDYIKLRTKDCKNLTIHKNKYSDDIADIEIGDKLIIATHGHKDKPRNCSEKLSTFLDRKPDFILLGHYHHYEEYSQNNINVKVNGSVISTDDYAFGLRLTERPFQTLVIHDKNGEEICTYKIKL